MAWLIGVDVGGTFTDFFAFDDETDTEFVHKTPSTPDNPARAILDGLRALCAERAIPREAISRLSHGTTVATNALIQRRGDPVALITTEGFRDLLEIGRQTRPKLYDFKADYPAPLVPRKRRFEIAERVGPEGEVIVSLDDAAIAAAVDKVRAADAKGCAVCLLFSFLNPEHERRIGAALTEALPDISISLSSDVQPEFREYERLSTTVLNAYLQPLMSVYMAYLRQELAREVPAATVGINQSSGGLMSVGRAQRFPIRTALSGPTAGAVGAIHVARLAGRPNVITLDVGGTSADVCLIRDYEAGISFERHIADFPVRLAVVDINTVGAGGGSVAWFDRDGLLKVGPVSAGAVPGPVCYGLGGDRATVTDANLAMGRLLPKGLLGGTMALDVEAARGAIRPIAEKVGFSVEKTAHGIVGIAISNMVRAIRAISVERGHDPRDFTLMAFGGAGPLHARDVAAALSIREMVVPPSPGILCAQGLVVSDLKEDFVTSARTLVDDANGAAMQARVDTVVAEAGEWFESEKVPADRRSLQLGLDMRYVGQNFELRVAIENGLVLPDALRLRALFFKVHEMNYGYHNPDDPVEVVNFRLTARGTLDKPRGPKTTPAGTAVPPATEFTEVHFEPDEPVRTPIHQRADLMPGHVIPGPALIEQLDTTTLVYPGDTATVDAALNLIVEIAS